jgi:hypothetical protein
VLSQRLPRETEENYKNLRISSSPAGLNQISSEYKFSVLPLHHSAWYEFESDLAALVSSSCLHKQMKPKLNPSSAELTIKAILETYFHGTCIIVSSIFTALLLCIYAAVFSLEW